MDKWDRIELKGLRVKAIIGLLEAERKLSQPLEFDVTIFANLQEASQSDNLKDTIDYSLICSLIEKIALENQDYLLEKLTARIVDEILKINRVEGVEVAAKKLDPPVPSHLRTSGVVIQRMKSIAQRKMHRAILALGSNLGDRSRHLKFAIEKLGNVVEKSQVFETKPIGGPSGQGPFFNMVIEIETELDPYALYRKCQEIEQLAGRERKVHWGPRTLDIDLLFYDDTLIQSQDLMIPHPRIHQRAFVMAPLAEIAPERLLPNWNQGGILADIRPIGPLYDQL